MAPVSRTAGRTASPSRRPATAPAQNRRTAAAAPTRRQAAQEPDEDQGTAFDAGADGNDDEGAADDGDLPEIINLSDVQATTYAPVPRGTYPGWIESVEYGRSQRSNAPMLTWTLKFMYDDGTEDKDGNPLGERERTVRWYTTLEGEGAGRTKASLAALDPELDLATLRPEDMDAHFADAEVNIRLTVRPDRDDPKVRRNNVAEVLPVDEGE